MNAREQDRAALKRIIASVFIIEADHRDELAAILHDDSLQMEQKSEKYLEFIVEHLEFVPDITEDNK